MEINDENEMDKKDENMVPKNINDNETNDNDNHDNDIHNNSQQQPIDDNMLINDAMKMPRQTHKPTIVHENFGHGNLKKKKVGFFFFGYNNRNKKKINFIPFSFFFLSFLSFFFFILIFI